MHIRKKGVALLETIIMLNIIFIIITLYSKRISLNMVKAPYFFIRDDMLTLEFDEENLLNEAEEYINGNEDMLSKLKEDGDLNGIELKVEYSKDKNLYIENNADKLYIIRKKDNKKKYREIRIDIEERDSMISLCPMRYVTNYIDK